MKECSKQVSYGILTSISVLLMFIFLTEIPWVFVYIETGRYFGPLFSLLLAALILVGIFACMSIVLYKILLKLKKTSIKWTILTNFTIAFLLILILFILYIQEVSEATQKIDMFITQNRNVEFQEYVAALSSFLDSNVQKAYLKPEAFFRSDNDIYLSPLGIFITKQLKLTRAAIIVYQGWGTCEQAAILIEELLLRAGYETRQAYFKNIDHKWAETKFNGTWLIIDPWYIGNLIEIQNLKTLRLEFRNATGVIVQYRNGTKIDASQEHGYYP